MAGRLLDTELKVIVGITPFITAAYKNFGSVLTNPAVKVMFLNTTDIDVYISIDGTTNKWAVPSGVGITWDESTYNIPNKGQEYYLAVGTQLTVTRAGTVNSTSGNVYANIITRTL